MAHAKVLILDFGSQFTQLIARRVRELGSLSLIVPGSVSLERIREIDPRAIILSGGPSSVYDEGAPDLAGGVLEWMSERNLPMLAICYGMQLLAHRLGGKVVSASTREYGRMGLLPKSESKFFTGLNDAATFNVWMSHGDHIEKLPQGFTLAAESASGSIAAMESSERRTVGLQFHPEVTHTEHGKEILARFLNDVAGLTPDWSMKSLSQELIAKISADVGPNAHAICALSGGVDSVVAASLVRQAMGDRLHCVFVDTGLMRKHERETVMSLFESDLKLKVTCVDARERFLTKLAGITDPEEKRRRIGSEFIQIFDEEAEKLKASLGSLPSFLVQGTLYPDVIESSPQGGHAGKGSKHAVTIKTHHNVGGLPKDMKFKLIEPLRELFKDEVRAIGREVSVPESFLKRHPFPGPGLAVRVLGNITEEKLSILREADAVFINALKEDGLYDKIWQAFVVFLPVRSVGVQGDGRTHNYVVALRAVTSADGMTADWYPFEHAFLAKVSNRISNTVRGVSRVVYDISSKPPATIEWE